MNTFQNKSLVIKEHGQAQANVELLLMKKSMRKSCEISSIRINSTIKFYHELGTCVHYLWKNSINLD